MKLHFIQVCPSDIVFWWQTFVQLQNFRELGYSDKARVLVFTPLKRAFMGPNPCWKDLEKLFPEAKFFYYTGNEQIEQMIEDVNYIPLLRPWTLMKHFKDHPELEQDAIFYHDSDVLITKPIDFDSLLQDDIIYLSWTGNRKNKYNYISYSHFLDKEKNIAEGMESQAKDEDIVSKLTGLFSLPKQRYTEAPLNTIGGAQSLLKGVNAKFFSDLLKYCYNVKDTLSSYNRRYVKGNTQREKEDNGPQAWAADMFALLFLLWKNGKTTHCPEELDFLWATDPIDRWDECKIYHDAGKGDGIFCKRKIEYANNKLTPFEDDLSWVSDKFCSYKYVKEIEKTKQLFNL